MKLFIVVFLFACCAAVFAEDLRIINPILYINKKEPKVISLPDKKVIYYRAKIIFMLYNAGKNACQIASKIVNFTSTLDNDGTLLLQLGVDSDTFLVENKEKKLPKIPLVMSNSSFEIVDLRPGEAVALTYEASISEHNFSKIKNVVFKYDAKNPNARYPFWAGSIKSEPYPFPGTKTFHIISEDSLTLPVPNLSITLSNPDKVNDNRNDDVK